MSLEDFVRRGQNAQAAINRTLSDVGKGFTFDEEKHLYRLDDGRIIPGHTRVLDLGGLVPYAHIEPDILERKSAIGREAHLACLLHDQEKVFTFDPRVEGYLNAWIDFRKVTGFKPFLCEYRDVYVFAGLPFGMQIDRLGRYPGEKQDTVIELKTCAQVMPHHGVQLAAQAGGVELNGIESPLARFLSRKREVIQLKPSGKWKRHPCTEKLDWEMFLHALAVTWWKTEREKFYSEVRHGDDDTDI